MAGLLDFLGLGGRAQMPRDPWQGLRQQGQMPQQGGGGILAQLLAPEVALPMAAALMGQQGNGQNFANAFGAAGAGLGEQRKLKAQTAERNKTLEYLRQERPDLADRIIWCGGSRLKTRMNSWLLRSACSHKIAASSCCPSRTTPNVPPLLFDLANMNGDVSEETQSNPKAPSAGPIFVRK